MLDVICWKWATPGYRSQFTAGHVNVLRSMVARHYRRPHRFSCITDDPAGIDGDIRIIPLWSDFADLKNISIPSGPSCYRRLKAFSAEAAEIIGPRFVSLDLDVVITGDCEPLWDRPEDLVIWGDTAPNTNYNGSMFLLTAGSRRQVWENFDPAISPRLAQRAGQRGSDQGWIGYCLGHGEATWSVRDGVYSWRNHLKPKGGKLPEDARITIWHGADDPWNRNIQENYPWVAQHWR